MNTITLGGKPVYGAPARDSINWFEYHSGASRPGVGMFLMQKSDVDSLLAGSPGNVSLVITDGSTGGPSSGTITLPVFIAGTIPFTTIPSPSGSTTPQPTDMVRVIVFDQRRTYTSPVNKSYNVIKQPIAYSGGDFQYFGGSLHGGTWTWAQLMSDMSLPAMGSTSTTPTWTPRNLIFEGSPINRVLDDIAARLWLIVGYDPTASTAGGGVKLYDPGTLSSSNTTLLASALSTSRNKGQKGTRSGLAVPGKFQVTFRGTGDYSDPTTHRVYTKDITVGTGTQSQPLNVGDQVAYWNGSAFANQSDLDTIAADIAQRAYKFLNSTRAEYEFIGLWNFTTDGYIRGVRWSLTDDQGAVTQIRIDNDEDWCAIDDLRRIIELSDNHLIQGAGQVLVGTNSGGGSKTVYDFLPSRPAFAVLVTDGGANATTPTGVATYTYTLKNPDTLVAFATGVSPSNSFSPDANREQGILTGPATDGIVRQNTDGTWTIIWCNERRALVACP